MQLDASGQEASGPALGTINDAIIHHGKRYCGNGGRFRQAMAR